jgi:hypothetical protein
MLNMTDGHFWRVDSEHQPIHRHEAETGRSLSQWTDGLRFAVAVAIVLLGHFMIWLVAESVMMPDAFGGTPTPFEDQAEAH